MTPSSDPAAAVGPPPRREHGALSRRVFAVAVLVSLVVLFAPPSGVPAGVPGVDKVVHAALFAALALTGRWAGGGRGVLTAVLVLYAAGSEVVQGLELVGRSASVADWLADVVGVLAGLTAWAAVARRRGAAAG